MIPSGPFDQFTAFVKRGSSEKKQSASVMNGARST
jgi:hypothetical protein